MTFIATVATSCSFEGFLDVACIHQTDHELMERGVYGLGAFLKRSKELRILWSPPYLTRLLAFNLIAFYFI